MMDKPQFASIDGPTTANDPNRLIWYSANCTYWTDNWNCVDICRIPCCPSCQSPGLQIKAEHWFDDINKKDRQHPGYKDLLFSLKEKCNNTTVITDFIGSKKETGIK